MEEQGDWSRERRRPKGSVIFADRSISADWASLQPDLVQLIADCLLSSSGVDEYMAMRAVCPSWRSAVAKPSPHAAVADLRFRPRQWVMLHGADDDQGRPLFLNVATGRFRRLRGPLLRDYIFVGASDGLLVLGAMERPHAARLLNPLTGDMLPFAASIPPEPRVETTITGTEPTIIFSFVPILGKYLDIPAYCDVHGHAVYSADPTGQLNAVNFHDSACNEENPFALQSMVSYAGNAYMLSTQGMLCKIFWTDGRWYAERVLEIDMYDTAVLVESSGKLLLVRDAEDLDIPEVFSVDVKRKVLEPIENIGSSAFFLNLGKCMIVDAEKHPSVDGNCIYHAVAECKPDSEYARYDLSDDNIEYICGPQASRYGPRFESDITHEGPLSLAQVLLTPCPDVKAQLDRIQKTKLVCVCCSTSNAMQLAP